MKSDLRNERFSRFWRLDGPRRAALFEAAWALTVAQAAIRLLPFRWIAARLGRLVDARAGALPFEGKPLSNEQVQSAQQVGWAVQKLARFLPWDARCLAQALAGKWMLQRRGLPSRFYLGVDRGRDNWLDAHAWLRCGGEFVTGEAQHTRFKVIAVFAQERD